MITLTGSIKPLSNTPEGVRNALEYLYRGLYTIGPKKHAGMPIKTINEALILLDTEFNIDPTKTYRGYTRIVIKFFETKERLHIEKIRRLRRSCPVCGRSRI